MGWSHVYRLHKMRIPVAVSTGRIVEVHVDRREGEGHAEGLVLPETPVQQAEHVRVLAREGREHDSSHSRTDDAQGVTVHVARTWGQDVHPRPIFLEMPLSQDVQHALV